MARLFLASIAVVSALAVVPFAGETQRPGLRKSDPPTSNPVYVKVILPGDLGTRDTDRPVVESWIAEDLKHRGQAEFTAASAWVPLVYQWDEGTEVDVTIDGQRWGCSVTGDIPERADGRIKVLLYGLSPGYASAEVTLRDEPGSRAIAPFEEFKTEHGMPYVAVLIGPPPENPAAPINRTE